MLVLLGYTYTMWNKFKFQHAWQCVSIGSTCIWNIKLTSAFRIPMANAFRPTKEIKLIVQERMYQ